MYDELTKKRVLKLQNEINDCLENTSVSENAFILGMKIGFIRLAKALNIEFVDKNVFNNNNY